MSTKLTRRRFFETAGAAGAGIALLGVAGCKPDERTTKARPSAADVADAATGTGEALTFRSRPDLGPPGVSVSRRNPGASSGYIFVAPKKGPGQDGPMILDDRGQLVWFRPLRGKSAMDFKAQRYRGRPVLTWWEGRVVNAHGIGEYVILDDSYREIARIPPAEGYHRDLHEFLITPRDTALLTAYDPVQRDLSPFGGPRDGVMLGGFAQEVDIGTGEVLFEWRSLDHVGLDESYSRPKQPGKPFDYFHINSIDVDHDGNLLVSARNTSAVYKIDRETGEVMWRLGGKESDFEMGQGTRTVVQHDARRQPDGTITILDNGPARKGRGQSRGIVVELDMAGMRATLVREYTHPDGLRAATQANMQALPNGNVFIGWGTEPVFSEFGGDGELVFDAGFLPEVETYRAFRFPWIGKPDDAPALTAERGSGDEVAVHASWNGATEVATWQALTGPAPGQLKPVGSVPRNGFETAITVRNAGSYVAVEARDSSGRVIGVSREIKLGS